MDATSPETEVPGKVPDRRKFVAYALSGMVSAIISGQVKAGVLPRQETEYLDGLIKAETGIEMKGLNEEEIGKIEKGINTPKLVTRIFTRVLQRITGTNHQLRTT